MAKKKRMAKCMTTGELDFVHDDSYDIIDMIHNLDTDRRSLPMGMRGDPSHKSPGISH